MNEENTLKNFKPGQKWNASIQGRFAVLVIRSYNPKTKIFIVDQEDGFKGLGIHVSMMYQTFVLDNNAYLRSPVCG